MELLKKRLSDAIEMYGRTTDWMQRAQKVGEMIAFERALLYDNMHLKTEYAKFEDYGSGFELIYAKFADGYYTFHDAFVSYQDVYNDAIVHLCAIGHEKNARGISELTELFSELLSIATKEKLLL